ncbi:MAG TPA: TRAP transporter substrate-binding protein DctP [Vicinamibacteria bacterium]|nr:TRAP transporter substrate-binding protein DctP [Vicinamibacteria bacterium]
MKRVLGALVAGACLLPVNAAAAEPVTLKLATLAPDGSSWSVILKEMAERWKTASGGRVLLRVYPGGVAGDEPDVVRKIRGGTLQAGLLTAVGLAEIDPSVHAMSVPLMYAGDDEANAVLDRLRPRLESAFESRGFVVLGWTDAGWVRFFTRTPAPTPDDLRRMKLFTWAGDPRVADVWRSAGFDAVPLPPTGILDALRTGRIDAVGSSPQVAVIARYHDHAPCMTDLPWQLVLGATVVDKAAWERVPADVRPALADAAAEAGRQLRLAVREGAARDVDAMKKRGLEVVAVPPAARALWQRLAQRLHSSLRGGIVPAAAFDEALAHRDEYRKRMAGR